MDSFFFVLVGLWSVVLITTVYNRLVGSYGLVDDSVDLSFLTTPLLAIILVYTIVTIFVFVAYLVLIKKVKKSRSFPAIILECLHRQQKIKMKKDMCKQIFAV